MSAVLDQAISTAMAPAAPVALAEAAGLAAPGETGVAAPEALFAMARQAILHGRPGVWFCGSQRVAVEPWIVATIYADRLCWRDYSRDTDRGEAFAAAWTWTESFALLQQLWDSLAESPASLNARVVSAPITPPPALPVWLAYELGACLEPAVRRGARPPAAGERPHADAPLAGFLIPRAWAELPANRTTPASSTSQPAQAATVNPTIHESASRETGRRLFQQFAAAVQSVARPVTPAQVLEPKPAPKQAPTQTPAQTPALSMTMEQERADYLQAVAHVQEYICAGDVYQVNVTRRMACAPRDAAGTSQASPTAPASQTAQAGDWFTAILGRHPAEQASFWSHIGAPTAQHFLSFTPERLLTIRPLTGGLLQLHTSPIKGTRPRPADASPARLTELADELMQDPKEQAELNMIIDMARNDLGRVARTGSVRVISSGRIDPLPFVLHRVADVTAEAAAPLQLLPLLKAVFPGASVTGAPKIRAMQIIEELENTPRGIYCGALGWLGHGHTADLALAIRTLAVSETTALATAAGKNTTAAGPAPKSGPHESPRLCGIFGVGAGIVADSDPDREWRETVAKSRGIVD